MGKILQVPSTTHALRAYDTKQWARKRRCKLYKHRNGDEYRLLVWPKSENKKLLQPIEQEVIVLIFTFSFEK